MPTKRKTTTRRRNPDSDTSLDPRSSQMYVDLNFEEENFNEDLSGENGPDAKRRAKAMLTKAEKTARSKSEAFTDLVMGLENRAASAIFKKLGKTRNRSNSNDSYDDYGTLSVYIPVDTTSEVRKVRSMFDREGRSYNLAPYITANGVTLLPKGVNGPIFKTEGSSFRRGADLDDWLDERPAARRRTR